MFENREKLLGCFLSFFIFAVFPSAFPQNETSCCRLLSEDELTKAATKELVRIEGYGSGGIYSPIGSGVSFGPNLVLTDLRILKNATVFQIVSSDGRQRMARLIGADYRSNLAAMLVDIHSTGYVSHVGNRLGTGDIAFAALSEDGRNVRMTPVKLGNYVKDSNSLFFQSWVQIEPDLPNGSAGAPVFNQYGELEGIVISLESMNGNRAASRLLDI